MKKSTFAVAKRLFIGIAFIAMTVVTTTSCDTEKLADHISNSIGNSWDFGSAANSIRNYSEWNSSTHTYDKSFGCYDDAASTLKRYTNNRMSVPGNWDLCGDYISIEHRANERMFYIQVRNTHTDEYDRETVETYIARYMY